MAPRGQTSPLRHLIEGQDQQGDLLRQARARIESVEIVTRLTDPATSLASVGKITCFEYWASATAHLMNP